MSFISWLCVSSAFAGDVAGKVTLTGPSDGPVVVYVEKVAGAKPKPLATPASMAQKGVAFAPSGLVVPVGATIDFPNQDSVFHNVFSLSTGNEFDLGLYRGGASKTATLATPGEVDVFCNIHPNMAAKILVVQNDFYAVVAADGSYTIAGVPAGTYDVIAWGPTQTPSKQSVVVPAAGIVKADYALSPRNDGAHLNKDGEQYGRYH
jgi:plastocyanin